MRTLTADRQRYSRLVLYGAAITLIFFLSACGDGSDSGGIGLNSAPTETETGSAMLNIKWHDTSTVKGDVDALADEALDCEGVGVATITCKVYDEDDNLITTGDAWPCSEHSGTLDEIPVGENRKFVILGTDDQGHIVFQGQKADITIDERPDNDVGTIEAHSFVPEGITATTNSAVQISLAWTQPNENAAPAGYRIYRDGTFLATSSSTAFTNTGLTQGTEYCYTVSAYDDFGNESGLSDQGCTTTDVSDDTDPPSVPAGLTASPTSASQINLTWTESNDNEGVTEYRIYRDGNQIGTSPTTSYSDTGLTQNTQYCYTAQAYDAVGNPSGQSEQACATTPESSTWYHDGDNDSYGDPTDSVTSATQPEGYVNDNTDCNDDAALVHPGAEEACNGVDDNCDGNTDEGLTFDSDEDGYSSIGSCQGFSDDCNDNNPDIHPEAEETCNGVDDDCDGQVDEGVQITYYRDADGDSYGDADNSAQACEPPTGYVTDNTDCDDDDETVHPGASEIYDEIDNDCDGEIDEGLTPYYLDADGDGYGDPSQSTLAMSQPDGYVTSNTDCNDDDETIHPGATEINDNIDNDCDGDIDEGFIGDAPIIRNISQDLLALHTGRCYEWNDISYSGTIYNIRFDYSDVDGDAHADDGASVGWLDPWTTFYGDGYSGSLTMRRCVEFGDADTTNVRATLTDGSGNQSNELTARIPKPAGYDVCFAQNVVADETEATGYTMTVDLGQSSGTFLFSYNTRGDSADRITITHEGEELFNSGCVNEQRSLFIRYSGSSTEIEVEVDSEGCSTDNSATWEYTVNCPGLLR